MIGMALGVGFLIALGLTVSMLLAGVLFGIGFIVLAATWPRLALLFLLGSAPFVWDVGGGPVKMAVADFALVLVLIAFVMIGRPRRVRNPLWIPIGAYFAVCLFSLFGSGLREGALSSLVQMVVYLVATVYVFSACIRDPLEVFPALYAFIAGNLVLVVLLFLAGSNYAFGLHKNNTGSSIGLGLMTAIGLWMGETSKARVRVLTLAILVLLAGLVFTLSRGSWMGAITGTLVMQLLRRQWKYALKMMALVVPIAAIVWMLLPSESKEVATAVGADVYTTKARLISIEYAFSHFRSSPVIGVGLGLRKTFDATNVVMTTLAETGVLGFLSFFSIFAVFAAMVWRGAKRIDVSDPAMVLLTVGAAFMTAKLVHGMVDHYWVRGILPVWAGAGLAVYAANRPALRRRGRAANPQRIVTAPVVAARRPLEQDVIEHE